jgi:hypothetical protein
VLIISLVGAGMYSSRLKGGSRWFKKNIYFLNQPFEEKRRDEEVGTLIS